jgi:hypothetical protein
MQIYVMDPKGVYDPNLAMTDSVIAKGSSGLSTSRRVMERSRTKIRGYGGYRARAGDEVTDERGGGGTASSRVRAVGPDRVMTTPAQIEKLPGLR